MGKATFHEVRANFESLLRAGEFVDLSKQGTGTVNRTLNTSEIMLQLEPENIALTQAS